MDGTNGLKETTLSVNVFTAPGKPMVGERHVVPEFYARDQNNIPADSTDLRHWSQWPQG
jgi:hypothetical protein